MDDFARLNMIHFLSGCSMGRHAADSNAYASIKESACLNPAVAVMKGAIICTNVSTNDSRGAGLAQPGKIERGLRAEDCQKHLHQLHICLPSGTGKTRLLYRMSMDFLGWTKLVPFIQKFWASIAGQVCTYIGSDKTPFLM